jgi:DNA-nicking Smr family endonuclease
VSRKKSRETPPPPKKGEETPLKHRALAGLEALRDALEAEEKARAQAVEAAKAKPRAPSPPKPLPTPRRTDEVWRPDLDKELFAVAMSGVVPLADKGKAARVKSTPEARSHGARDAGTRMRRAQAEGGEVIVVRWHEDGTCEGARKGRTFALEALGRFAAPEETLDLHRLDPVEARARVEEFVRTRRARGRRVVAIVHGLGRHAPDGQSVLRDVVVEALSQPPASREIDAFRSGEGPGAGAMLVALRRR